MNKNSERIAFLSAPGADSQPVLRSVHASGEINGLMLRMRLKQLYQNTSKEELETVYSFPLAWGTTLLGMRVTLNGKEMAGAVIEKKQAEERYEDAISSGDLPVMLVRESKDINSARLGNLKPGDEASVEIEYGQILRTDQGQIRVTVPTTIAPRFGRDPGLAGLMSHAIGALDPLTEHRFILSLEIHGPLAQAKIQSPSHTVTKQATESGLCIEISQRAMLDRDFILSINGLDDLSICAASADPGTTEDCTLFASFVPRLSVEDTAPRPAQLKLLVDCSGSMAGDGMRLARAGMAHAVSQMLPVDHVSFSCFGSNAVHMHKRMAMADERLINRLLREASILEAELGGTELDQALREVIAIPGPEEDEHGTSERCAILLITDGEVWDIDSIVRTVRASGHAIYAIGVGSAPAESLLRELAEISGGGCELIAPKENIESAVSRLLSKLRAATDIEIGVEIDGEHLPVSPISRHVAPGEMVHLWCRLEHRPVKPPRLLIHERGGKNIQLIEPATIQWSSDSAVARMGAAHRLLDISDEKKIKEIALRYQLVTEHSSFFLVHERATLEKATGVPELRQIGSMMTAGWGGAGTVFASTHMDFNDSLAFPSTTDKLSLRMSSTSLRTPAAWRRESGSSGSSQHTNSRARTYSSLAQATKNLDEADNPLRELLQKLVSANSAANTIDRILEHVGDSASRKMLQSVLDQISVILGSDEAALAVLLDWASQLIAAVRISRRCLRPVSAILTRLPADAHVAARAYLDAEAAKPADPLPTVRESFDIPAFLRRQAD